MFNLQPWQLFLVGLMSMLIFTLVASYDIEQAEEDHKMYCMMVDEGSWPAYDYNIKCD